ncbi:MAG: GNAT family N-acetyltransferase, partial [Nitrospinota bacterium]|nr:GNAT family N-acetyltransferase [Nitrospinota bacterium]
MEWRKDNYLITDDRTRMDIGAIHALLDATYWAAGRSLAAVEKSVANSLCFGLFHEQKQVGFARVVTDGAVFAWLCDVVLEQSHRNRGVGSWMMEAVLEHP